jgi:ADP-heptose:LPS heptosyltransferase
MNMSMMPLAASAARRVEGFLRPETRAEASNAKSVMVLEFMLPLGVLVHMTPLFEALKVGGKEVTVATRGLGMEVLRHSPFVDHLIEVPDPLASPGAAARVLRRELRARGIDPDVCLTATSDRRTRVALLAARVCGGWRGGFTAHASLYHHALRTDDGLSQIGNNLRLAKLVACADGHREPKVFFTARDVAKARMLLGEGRDVDRPRLVVVSQGSGGQRTGWHDGRWVRVLRHAEESLGFAVFHVGTARDAAAIEALRAEAGGIGVSLAGKTGVGELAAVLALSDMVVAIDTGTMHVGRAVGVPMVVLGPSWQKPLEWLPLGKPQVRILRGEDRVGVPEGYRLDEISAESVVAALHELSGLYPAIETAREARVAAGLSEIDLLRRR